MLTRRMFVERSLSTGILLGAGSSRWALGQEADLRARNKAVVRRYKESQGTSEAASVASEVLAADYRRLRAGMANLGNNARDQGFPSPGPGLRTAFPDRVDIIEDMIADGDRVGMLFRVTGTHLGNFYGIPATGRSIDIYEVGLFKLADGQIIEGWFMVDEAGLLKQLGAQLPPRDDGRLIAPPITDTGEDGDTVLARLTAMPPATQAERNKITVARSKSSSPPSDLRAADYTRLRAGFQHLGDLGRATGAGDQTIGRAFPDRRDKVDNLLAEGDKVWMKFRLAGTNVNSIYGLPPTHERVEVPEIGIMRFDNGAWKEGWYFGDELGLLLQLGVPDALV